MSRSSIKDQHNTLRGGDGGINAISRAENFLSCNMLYCPPRFLQYGCNLLRPRRALSRTDFSGFVSIALCTTPPGSSTATSLKTANQLLGMPFNFEILSVLHAQKLAVLRTRLLIPLLA